MRRILPFSFFRPPVQFVRLCHTNNFSGLTPNQISKFKHLENVELAHFKSRDYSWYEIDLLKRLMEGDCNYSSAPLSAEDAFAQLDVFKRLPINALNEEQMDLLNELYEYGLRRAHLDLAKITPPDVLNGTTNFTAVEDVLEAFGTAGIDAYFYTWDPKEWIKFFKNAFIHHVMKKVTGFDVYEDQQGISHNHAKFFDEISHNPVLLKESVEKTLDEMKGLDSVELALMSYGIEKKDLNSMQKNYLMRRKTPSFRSGM